MYDRQMAKNCKYIYARLTSGFVSGEGCTERVPETLFTRGSIDRLIQSLCTLASQYVYGRLPKI